MVVSVEAPATKVIDRKYILDLSERACRDIDDGNYDSAITKSRTILEETFFFVIEKKDDVPSASGDINKLYTQVKNLYDMHGDKNLDKRINMLLSGLEKIISAIAEMRNNHSDSHGVGSKRIDIFDYHARLFVNSSVAMSDFILSVYLNSIKKTG
ncbi:MAG: abortive infection family protein [Methanocorpusculum sp.]|uniref:abortive infection family protein n=1 Tax=Methanocorpusculum sp. TaxID=2058474 RepID=UPI002721F618|nr:abortive infection family protein [Methanocorpusculum sp.]MDO9523719.1 abortive infection family protein [Methanocorpusculum sp.]